MRKKYNLLLIALILILMGSLAGCSGSGSSNPEEDIELVESGFSLETDSCWAVIYNNSDKTYRNVNVYFLPVDKDGNESDDDPNTGALLTTIPFAEPSTTYVVSASIGADSYPLPIDDVLCSYSAGSVLPDDSDVAIIPEFKGENLSIDGSEIVFDINNYTDIDFDYYEIYILIKDSDGNYVGSNGSDQRRGLPAGSVTHLKAYVDGDVGNDVEVYVRPYDEEENNIQYDLEEQNGE